MSVRVTFPKADTPAKGHVVVTTFDDTTLGTNAKKIDKSVEGLISSALKKRQNI